MKQYTGQQQLTEIKKKNKKSIDKGEQTKQKPALDAFEFQINHQLTIFKIKKGNVFRVNFGSFLMARPHAH